MGKSLKKSIWVLLILVIPIYFFYNPSKFDFFPKCPLYKTTGIYCPGCGSQRAIHDIVHFNLTEALSHNLLAVTIIPIALFSYLFFRNFYNKVIYHPKTPWVFFVLVLLFWILRNLPSFSYLAP